MTIAVRSSSQQTFWRTRFLAAVRTSSPAWRGSHPIRRLSSARPLPSNEDSEEDESQPKPRRSSKSMTTSRRSQLSSHSTTQSSHQGQTRTPVENENDPYVSPSKLTYTGGVEIPVTTRLRIVKPGEDVPSGVWPVFRLMDENGVFRNPNNDGSSQAHTPPPSFTQSNHQGQAPNNLETFRAFLGKIHPYHEQELLENQLLYDAKHVYPDTQSKNTLLRVYRQILRIRLMDDILQNAQRQGRISFYMTCTGEEAIHMGAASALEIGDPLLCQYREQGLLMWRGFTIDQFTNQCFSNVADLGKGRQMPVHYGSRALNYHTISSPLGTQLPHAVGAAYRLKLEGKPNVAVTIFGEGCSSTTDFHSALNFAATLHAPVIFLCRNNGYAISTSVKEQYHGDGVVARAPGYGMAGIRVDGNDVFAVHAAIRRAKIYALENNAPVLVEAMTYRQGHHSTSDDSLRYRSKKEVQTFADHFDPLSRLELFLRRHGWITESDTAHWRDEEKIAILKSIEKAEKRPKPPIEELFRDVYHDMPPHLQRQESELKAHLAKYPNNYQ